MLFVVFFLLTNLENALEIFKCVLFWTKKTTAKKQNKKKTGFCITIPLIFCVFFFFFFVSFSSFSKFMFLRVNYQT